MILLGVIDIFSKYVSIAPLKGERVISFTNAIQKIWGNFCRTPNKIWVDKGNDFYNSSIKSRLHNNNTEIYSTRNDGQPGVAERFVKTIKIKACMHMTSASKNIYNDKSDKIVVKYINIFHIKIKVKPINVNSNTYIDLKLKILKKTLNLKSVTMGEYIKNIFSKRYEPNWLEEVVLLKKFILMEEKFDLKVTTGIDTLDFAKKIDYVNFKCVLINETLVK